MHSPRHSRFYGNDGLNGRKLKDDAWLFQNWNNTHLITDNTRKASLPGKPPVTKANCLKVLAAALYGK